MNCMRDMKVNGEFNCMLLKFTWCHKPWHRGELQPDL